jgi:hypothetical protein
MRLPVTERSMKPFRNNATSCVTGYPTSKNAESHQ